MPRRVVPILIWAALAGHSETIDRIAVTVGPHVISERDVIQDLRLSAFLDSPPALDNRGAELSPQRKRQAAARLVDQYLVLEDAALTRAPLPSAADVAPMIEPLKARYAGETEFRAALSNAQITEEELNAHLLAGLRMLRYTDTRFRPEVQLTEEALRTIFESVVAQSDRSDSAAPQPTFEESRPKLEKLLTDQQVMRSMDSWLEMTRHDTSIRYREAAFQ